MIVISNFKKYFVKEEDFLIKTEKAYFVKISQHLGIWLSKKVVDFNREGKNGKKYFAININKRFEYELYKFYYQYEKLKTEKINEQKINGDGLLEFLYKDKKTREGK